VADTPIGVLLKHLQDPAPSVLIARPDLPPAVGDVLDKVLLNAPADRFNSAGELARAFRAAFAGGLQFAKSASTPAVDANAPGVLSAATPAAPRIESVSMSVQCPECSTLLPPGAGICPACKYMIPLDQLPTAAARPRLQHRNVIVSLLPQGIRWTPDGLQLARRLAGEALREATRDGWEPASIGEPFRLIEGRTIGGSVVESAILSLERLG
jgi:hypothetical protein